VNYTIRPCHMIEEFASCVVLQRRIWGYKDIEIYPLRMFVNVSKIGGHVLGAFTPKGPMAGFLVSIPAWRKDQRFFHSLMLCVLPDHQNQGVGRMLKLAQRRAALRAGIDYIEWTFDPLRAKNAYFNIVRLGAVVRRYCPDYYGLVQSKLQRRLPSDRLIAEWYLKSPRVKRAISGKNPRTVRKTAAAEVAIPLNLDSLIARTSARAREWQSYVRARLQDCFSRKLAITGFEKTDAEAWYLLDRL